MKIVLLTAGSRGDTQPFLALGIELKKLGHDVAVAASHNFAKLVEGCGLTFRPTRIDVNSVIQSGQAADAIHADNPLSMLSSISKPEFINKLLENTDDLYKACSDADAVIYHPGGAIGHYAALEKNIPSVFASPFPMAVTPAYPALILYKNKLPRFLNSLSHRIFQSGFWMATKLPLQIYLKKNVKKYMELKNPLKTDPLIVSCSQAIFPTPLPARAFGYWNLKESSGFQPPKALGDFLDKGEKPIYIGFGSVGNPKDAAENTRMIIKAVSECGKRAVISKGIGGLDSSAAVPENILFIDDTPHYWLFQKVTMAIHHGGAGTTAAAFHAGIPQAIIPHGNDQFAWGMRVNELGVGPAYIHVKDLSVEKLKSAIEFASRADIVKKAAELGENLSREDGAADAARYLSSYFTEQTQLLKKKPIGKTIARVLFMLSIPIGIGLIGGGAYFGIQLLRGVSFNESVRLINSFSLSIKPAVTVLTLIMAAGLVWSKLLKPLLHWLRHRGD